MVIAQILAVVIPIVFGGIVIWVIYSGGQITSDVMDKMRRRRRDDKPDT